MQSRKTPRPLPRPNELSDMGRVNAGPPSVVVGGRARSVANATGRSTVANATGRAPAASVRVRPAGAGLAILAALAWFLVSTVADVADWGPELDAISYFGTLGLTGVVSAIVGRSARDDVSVAIGAGLGLLVGSFAIGIRPEHHPVDGTVETAILSAIGVLVIAGATRLFLARRPLA